MEEECIQRIHRFSPQSRFVLPALAGGDATQFVSSAALLDDRGDPGSTARSKIYAKGAERIVAAESLPPAWLRLEYVVRTPPNPASVLNCSRRGGFGFCPAVNARPRAAGLWRPRPRDRAAARC